jgi:type II secretory pathway pseudopilin PulG
MVRTLHRESDLKPSKNCSHRRSTSGASLIEMLVAIIFGSLIALMLTNLFSQTMRESTSDQNSQTANTIAQELIDYTRNFDFNTLSSLIGTYQLLPTNTFPGRIPVTIDLTTKTWSSPSQKNIFPGTVTYSIQSASPQTLLVTVLVNWSDSSNNARQVLTSTVVVQNGSRYWY